MFQKMKEKIRTRTRNEQSIDDYVLEDSLGGVNPSTATSSSRRLYPEPPSSPRLHPEPLQSIQEQQQELPPPPRNDIIFSSLGSGGSSLPSRIHPESPQIVPSPSATGGASIYNQHHSPYPKRPSHALPQPPSGRVSHQHPSSATLSETASSSPSSSRQQQKKPLTGHSESQYDDQGDHDSTTGNGTKEQQQHHQFPFPWVHNFWEELQSLVEELWCYFRFKRSWKKKVISVCLAIVFVFVFYDLFWGHKIYSWMEDFILWMTNHTHTAVFAFVAIFMISTLIFIPPALLLFGAGYSFSQAIGIAAGLPAAIMACFLGSSLGAIIAFSRARFMERELIKLFSDRYPLVKAADRALKQDGFRCMLLLRLCPLIPFNGLNYCCGVTGVSLTAFITSLIGILPFQIYTISVGATAGMLSLKNVDRPKADGDDSNYEHQFVGWIVLILSGIIFGLFGVVTIWRLVKKELAKELHMSKDELKTYLHREPSRMNVPGSPPHRSRRGSIFAQQLSEKSLVAERQQPHQEGIEAEYLPTSIFSPCGYGGGRGGRGIDDEPCEDDQEEWFWIWA